MNTTSIAAMATLIVATAGCKRTLDHTAFEKNLDERVRALGLTPGAITCPASIEPKAGATFICKIAIESTSYDLTVTIQSIEGSHVELATAWTKGPAVIRAKLVSTLPAAFEKELSAKVSIDCGTEPLLFVEAGKVACKLSSGKAHSTAKLKFDDKLEITGWELDPPLVGRKRLEGLLTPSVAAKTSPTVKVDCGPEDLIERPADGVIWCSIADATNSAKIRVTMTPDLKIQEWATATPP